MAILITLIHVFVCLILIAAVLLQSGKAADLAGAFGGVGSQSVFGPRGSQTFLSKITTVCAILFMLTSIGLWLLSGRESASVVNEEQAPVTEQAATATETTEQGEEQGKTGQEEETAETANEPKKENEKNSLP